ncbi:hypothetical protein [Streptomyces sp. NPDC058280]|uniref:hypothetical protein n=1 Tax=Streptomyces sp. NPDC058280 TaxID=3346419 RepID=UPI0036EFB0D2
MESWIRFWTALWIGSSAVTRWVVDWLCNAKPASAPQKPAGDAGESTEQPEAGVGEQPKKPKKKPAKGSAKKAAEGAEGSALLRWAGLGITLAVVKATPYTTVAVALAAVTWVLIALALGYAATGPVKPPAGADETSTEPAAEQPPADTRHPRDILTREHVALLLDEVYTEGSGVHLAALAEHLTRTPLVGLPPTPWKTADVRHLLARHEVRVRDGVRVPPKGGREGVHREDFPPLPQPPSDAPVGGVVVPGQSNNNNTDTVPPFVVVDDPDNPARSRVHHVTGR